MKMSPIRRRKSKVRRGFGLSVSTMQLKFKGKALCYEWEVLFGSYAFRFSTFTKARDEYMDAFYSHHNTTSVEA